MTIPTYKEIIPHLLKFSGSGESLHIRDSVDYLANKFSLTDEEKERIAPNKSYSIFYDRIGWAKSSLYRSGLLDMVSRGIFKINDAGLALLSKSSEEVIEYVDQNYRASSRSFSREIKPKNDDSLTDSTPDELMQSGYLQIKNNLKNDLLDKVMEMSPIFFEHLVVKLLKNMGYGDPVKGEWTVTQGSNDEGIDGVIKEDALGLEVIYIQAKRWANTVGRPEIQKFMGALAGKGAKKGVFITTSDYSSGAIEYAEKVDMRIILIDGSQLAEYMIDYNVGVSHENTYVIKSVDTDFFEE